MPVKVGKGKGKKGSKKKGKKKGGKRKKGKKGKKTSAKLKKIAGELSTDQLLQYRIMKEDRGELQLRCKGAEDRNTILETKLKQIQEDQSDIFENLRSKVEKSKAYAKVLLDQRDVLEREKKDSIETLESQLDKKAAHLRHSRGQLKTLKERWGEQQGRMKSAAHTLAVRAEMEEKARTLEKELKQTKEINQLRESQNSIIATIEDNAEVKAVAAMLLECLKQFPQLRMVQRESIQSLTKILNLKNCDLVIDSQGVQLVMRAIQTHSSDVTLLAACCRLLWRLYVDADHKKMCELFAQTNTRDVVLSILQNHPSDRHLHYNIVGLFKCMLSDKYAYMFDQRVGHRYHENKQHRGSSRQGSSRRGGSRHSSRDNSRDTVPMNHSESLPTLQTPETISPRDLKKTSSVGILPPLTSSNPTSTAWTKGNTTIESSDRHPKTSKHAQNHHHHHHHHHRHHHHHHHQKPTMIAKHKQKEWRAAPKKSDIRSIVRTLLKCMDHYAMEDVVVEKCMSVLSILLFDETEKEALSLNNYESLRSNEKAEAARGLALDVIEQVIPGGEVDLVHRFVTVLRAFQLPKHNVLQGMVLLLIQKILPEDPEIKTIYIRTFKELGVNNAVFDILSLDHAMVDADLKGVGMWILEYFAMPPPGKKKRKKKILDNSLAAEF